MTSPMVDRVREIPLSVEQDFDPMDVEETGFPFDDFESGSPRSSFNYLDDLAQRHPEFAPHLEGFRTRNNNRPSHSERSRIFADRPFAERFDIDLDDFFGRSPSHSTEPPFNRGSPQQQARATPPPSSSSANTNEDTNQPESSEGRSSRRPGKNIQPSNTVDLGQKQEPVDDRTQRSMSAPPPDNRKRYVSSVNIPINPTPAAGTSMGQSSQPQSSPHQAQQPTERVIPIHVEGRDEPVIPKSFAGQSNAPPQYQQQQSQQHQQQQQHPQTDKFFGYRPRDFTQFIHREPGFRNDWQPSNWYSQNYPANQGQFDQGRSAQGQPTQSTRSAQPPQQPQAQHPPSHPQWQPQPQRQPQQPTQPQPDQRTEQAAADLLKKQQEEYQTEQQEKFKQQPEAPTKPQKSSPIDQIKAIQKDVSELMNQVEKFAGKPRDKEYIYLDEMLTRNLIRLDNIETEGQENIRSARKEAIKCIEKCIGVLEAKANSNVQAENPMDVEARETTPARDDIEKKEDTAEEGETTMEVEPITEPSNKQEVGEENVVKEEPAKTEDQIEVAEQQVVPENSQPETSDPKPETSTNQPTTPPVNVEKEPERRAQVIVKVLTEDAPANEAEKENKKKGKNDKKTKKSSVSEKK